MKNAMKKLLSVMLVALLLVSAVPFRAFAADCDTIGHTYASYVSAEATCTENGTEVYKCMDCGDTFENAILATGHTMANGECTVCGYTENTALLVSVYYVDSEDNAVWKKDVTVDNADSLSNDALVAKCYDGEYSKYKLYKSNDGTAQLLLWVIETPADKALYTLTLIFNNGTSDKVSFEVLEGTGILEAIEEYGVKVPAYEGHKFVGSSFSHTTNDAAQAGNVVNRYHVIEGDTKLWVDWDVISDDDDKEDAVYDAVLKIYTNGKTSAAAKTVDLDIYAVDGKITRDEVEACVKKYYKAANNNGMTFYGLFTNGIANYKTAAAVKEVVLDANKTTTIYVMVTNATAITTTTTPADKTNPQTGDAIGIALAVMMCSGGAVLTLGKKKFF